MKKTLQKVIITTMALAGSLALITQASQAGQNGHLSPTAKGSQLSNQKALSPSALNSKIGRLSATTLWYNGDFNGVNGLANELDTSLGSGQYAHVYDDFVVNCESGWDITAVFSHDLENTNVVGATWEIRQGVSEGNPGTLIASGTTATPEVTVYSGGGFGFTEFQIKVTGLSVHLDPGTYFLNVTPQGDLTGRSFDSTTSGANCVGTPCGNNQNAFFDSNFFGAFYTSTANEGQPSDFSMGVEGSASCEGTPTPTPSPTPMGDMLWYNGDFNGVNGLANELDTSLGEGQYAHVYDDFNVNDSEGWDVTSVYSHDLENTNVVGATWEIRQGISEGNPGTLIASGTTSTPEVTVFSGGGFGFTEFQIKVNDLNVHLDPGTYFLNVTPQGDLTGRSFDSTTSGANCVGTPCGNNQNAFFDSNFFGAFYTSTANEGQPSDFSMGVNGTVSGGGGGITLTVTVDQQNGKSRVNLSWSPADGGDMNVLRNGQVAFTTPDDGFTRKNVGTHTGTTTFQVCETDSGDCSNVVEVTIP
ncbi:MAG TPA: hypothetical protein VH207_07900 [Chthoniobacterales bacterium]|jgi:hypothetical protein|nr:hypothetical protein [Chthoniobacterales bacterium]